MSQETAKFYADCYKDIAKVLGYRIELNENADILLYKNSHNYREIPDVNKLILALNIIAFTQDKNFRISDGSNLPMPKGVYWITDEVSST